ncbi:sensor histidine protein kinase [Weissella oryzae SG25]|uniref:histidine kinase n=1 Tax=Weissella oryzae (strain DSM 25784 / JCM 18191 / LMG 30913 / SG25) TaxID=1329250 RepID=A0A069CV09_WEIOS|nr:ATP-binding protein [Weissella oryzae]GAK31078.1 sensor histidine protein kinase [Weissella oryzae SG25]
MRTFIKRFSQIFVSFLLATFLLLELLANSSPAVKSINWSEITLIVLLFATVGAAVMTYREKRRISQLALIMDKLALLQDAKLNDGLILLKPGDDYYALAQSINAVQAVNTQHLKQLQQQDAILQTLMTNLPIGVLQIESDRRLSLMNQQASNILALDLNKVDQAYDDVLQQHQLLSMIEHGLANHGSEREQINLQFNGQTKVLDVTAVYYRTRASHFALLVLLYDITDLTRLQNGQNDFVANASHELRTPLTAISGFVETLLAGAANDSEVRQEFLMIIQDETKRLLALTEDILTLAKNNLQQYQYETINLAEISQEILRSQTKQITEANLQIENHINQYVNIKYALEPIYQILNNLITNAIKYNRINGKIDIFARVSNMTLTIQVKDTGLGISSEEQERIFERFYRVDKSRQKKIAGTGLGLSIVQNIVDQADGTVAVDSQVGVGTTMTVVLPLNK